MINIIKDIPLINEVFKYDVILVGMGLNNSMYRGFAYEVRINFPEVLEYEKANSPYGDTRKMGKTMEIKSDGPIFCMCYVVASNGRFINYDALASSLRIVSEKYKGKKIASSIIGSTEFDGKGDKDKIVGIFEKAFTDCDIDVYDYVQKDYSREIFHEIAEIHKLYQDKKIDSKEYATRRSEIEWRRRNGIFKPMPDGYDYKPKMGYIKDRVFYYRNKK